MKHKWVRDKDVNICDRCWYVLDKRDDNVPVKCPGKPPSTETNQDVLAGLERRCKKCQEVTHEGSCPTCYINEGGP